MPDSEAKRRVHRPSATSKRSRRCLDSSAHRPSKLADRAQPSEPRKWVLNSSSTRGGTSTSALRRNDLTHGLHRLFALMSLPLIYRRPARHGRRR